MSDWVAGAPATAHVIVAGPLTDDVVVEGDDGHHLQRVRRLRVGEQVTAADGAGAWRPYRVTAAAGGRLDLVADGVARREPCLAPELTVAFGLTKGEKPEVVVARLTELGVDRIVPALARRSVVRWREARRDAGVGRLRRVAREAAMQCRRATVPVVESPVELADLRGRPGLVVAARDGHGVTDLPPAGAAGWLVVVGPEGGLDPDEVRDLGDPPRLAVGPHVVRAETAAVAAAALLTAHRRARPATERDQCGAK